MRARAVRGSAIAEALVAMGLAAMACAALASTGALAVRALGLARDAATAATLAAGRSEALRSGPRARGADTVAGAGGTTFARRWDVSPGRGVPTRLSVAVGWREHELVLDTAVLP